MTDSYLRPKPKHALPGWGSGLSPKNRSGLNSKGSEYVRSSRSIALGQYDVSGTWFVDVLDLPDVDENIGTRRNQISVVLVIDSRTSHGYSNQVRMRRGRRRKDQLVGPGVCQRKSSVNKASMYGRDRRSVNVGNRLVPTTESSSCCAFFVTRGWSVMAR